MSELLFNYLSLFKDFRAEGLDAFAQRHESLFREAQARSDYADVTAHYYSKMAPLIESAYGSNWHFCPPEHEGQSREQAIAALHRRVGQMLAARPGMEVLDIGCGTGGALRAIARDSGARVTGISIGAEEIELNNRYNRRAGMDALCRAVRGDVRAMPFEAGTFDGAYAIYSLKYFARLQPVFAEIARVLKPGALLVSYNIVRTPQYDANNPEHVSAVEGFEYACGMPPLPSAQAMIDAAASAGLACVTNMDLSDRYRWDHYFARGGVLPVLLGSQALRSVVAQVEAAGLLGKGFARFMELFVSGNVHSLLKAAELGALSGSNMLVFRKDADA